MSLFPKFIIPDDLGAKPANSANFQGKKHIYPKMLSKISDFSRDTTSQNQNFEFIQKMTLGEFEKDNYALEINVPGLIQSLWFAPGIAETKGLVSEGISRGRIWTAGELKDLITNPLVDPAQALFLAQVKMEFDGEITEVRQIVEKHPGKNDFHKLPSKKAT